MSMEHWIKVRKGMHDSPKMRAISFKCGCTLPEAFVGWFRLFCYFDSNTDNGTVEYFSSNDVDTVSGVKGMGQALVDIGWLKFNVQDCEIVNWQKHNGQSAKYRLQQSERQVKSRRKKRAVNV